MFRLRNVGVFPFSMPRKLKRNYGRGDLHFHYVQLLPTLCTPRDGTVPDVFYRPFLTRRTTR